ncbi:MAG: branched-chain amino acid aminotransferase [Candidatus Lokiarchaeota archaeon]|nr:branched-chain amino acid aminotransferase [Candidatus Lokiarchaeota archaeon]
MQATRNEIDFNNLGFDFIQTDWMFLSDFKNGEWDDGELLPYSSIELSPSACILNYGQGIFEGMKALKSEDGRMTLFRPLENAKRFIKSAERLVMPPFAESEFLSAVEKVVRANERFVPPYETGGSLYIRPLMIGTEPLLGIKPAREYKFIIFCSPVGPYFPEGFKGINLLISKKFTRASLGGTGFSKTCSNYAGTMKPATEAKKDGYDQILYLDSVFMKFISEVGSANFCAIINDTLVTPRLDGTILEGITLKSVLTIAERKFGIKTEQRDISYQELFNDSCTETFCTGTAAVITPIGSITYQNKSKTFNNQEPGDITKKLYNTLVGIQRLDIEDEFAWVQILE